MPRDVCTIALCPTPLLAALSALERPDAAGPKLSSDTARGRAVIAR